MKRHTTIPYARQAASLLQTQTPPDMPSFSTTPEEHWSRVLHFESRYWSIDQLLSDLSATNIL